MTSKRLREAVDQAKREYLSAWIGVSPVRNMPLSIGRSGVFCRRSLLGILHPHRVGVVSVLLAMATLPALLHAAAPSNQPVWVHNEVGEAPDPAIRYGELPNGLRYAIMRNATPEKQVVIRYVMAVGTADEAADEAEFAHTVEHLAFRASKDFPDGDAVAQLQKAGLDLGLDANASTSSTETEYALQLPSYSPQRLLLAFRFLRSASDGLRFTDNDVLRERGIVAAEIGVRESQAARAGRKDAGILFPEVPALQRAPAERLASLEAATPARLQAFHDRWYKPGNAFLVIVGDIDPDVAQAAIEKQFGDWQGGPASRRLPLPPFAAPRTNIAIAKEDGLVASLTLASMHAEPESPLTIEQRRRRIAADLGLSIVRARLAERIPLDPSLPIIGVASSAPRRFGLSRGLAISARVQPGRWRDAATLIAGEIDRAKAQGFTTEEVDRGVLAELQSLRARSFAASTRYSTNLANEIAEDYRVHEPMVLPERAFQRTAAIIQALTPAEVKSAFVAAWDAGPTRAFLAGPADMPADEPAVLAAIKAGEREKAEPLGAPVSVKEFSLTGSPGHAVEVRHTPEATLVRLSNGVRLNIRTSKYRAGEVVGELRLAGGIFAFPPRQPIPAAPIGFLPDGGAGGLNAAELSARLRGLAVSARVGAGVDAFVFSATTNKRDLETQLKLWTALIGAPQFDPRANGLLRHGFEAALEGIDATPAAAFSRNWGRFIHGGDARWRATEPSDAALYDMTKMKTAYGPLLATGPIEVTLVGDLDEGDTIALAEKTLGRLPTRNQAAVVAPGGDHLVLPNGGDQVVWSHRGDPARAIVAEVWPAPDGNDVKRTQQLDVLGRLLQFRIYNDLRQVAGATYSPSVLISACSCERDFGYIGILVEVATKDIPLAERVIRAAAAGLRDLTPAQDDFQRTVAPMIARAETANKTNQFWVGMLEEAQGRPDLTAAKLANRGGFSAITPEQVQQLGHSIFSAKPILVQVQNGEP